MEKPPSLGEARNGRRKSPRVQTVGHPRELALAEQIARIFYYLRCFKAPSAQLSFKIDSVRSDGFV